MGSLTRDQRSLVIGSILGDGCLRVVPKRANALLEINHSIKAKEYCDWKYGILSSICNSPPKMRATNGTRVAYRFITCQNEELTNLYKTFYLNGKKSLLGMKESLDSLSLAVWFMDDGSKCRPFDVYLNTQQFSYSDQVKLVSVLADLGIEARINSDKYYHRLRILKHSVERLNSLVAQYIVPSMRYKLSYDPVET